MSPFNSKQEVMETSHGKVEYTYLSYDSDDLNISAKIAVKEGNNLFSYIVNGKELIFYDDSLPIASFAVGNPLLFPFPNRIEDAMYTWQGKTYLQKKSGIPIQLHSMLFDETSFEFDGIVQDTDSITLKTHIDVDETHPIYRGYPFCFKLEFNYILEKDGISIEYVLHNTCGEEMPYGIAFHPYFNKLDNDTEVLVDCKYYYEVRDDAEPEFFNKTPDGLGMTGNVMPTGNLLEVTNTKYDLSNIIPVKTLDLDTVYTNLKPNKPAKLIFPDTKLELDIETTLEFMHYVVYTAPDKPFICIEPQTCSTDAINLYSQGIEHVNLLTCMPNTTKKGYVKYKVSKK